MRAWVRRMDRAVVLGEMLALSVKGELVYLFVFLQ